MMQKFNTPPVQQLLELDLVNPRKNGDFPSK